MAGMMLMLSTGCWRLASTSCFSMSRLGRPEYKRRMARSLTSKGERKKPDLKCPYARSIPLKGGYMPVSNDSTDAMWH